MSHIVPLNRQRYLISKSICFFFGSQRFKIDWKKDQSEHKSSMIMSLVYLASEYLDSSYLCNGLNVNLNRTSSVPKSVLRYELDKGQDRNFFQSILFPK